MFNPQQYRGGKNKKIFPQDVEKINYMRFVENKSVKEIAAEFGVSSRLIYSKLNYPRFENTKNMRIFVDKYAVNNAGEIFNTHTNKKIKTVWKKNGDEEVFLCIRGKQKSKLVKNIVAETFLENTKNCKRVIHKDGNKKNNNVDNLEWVPFKIDNKIKKEIKNKYFIENKTQEEIAKEYKISRSYVEYIVNSR